MRITRVQVRNLLAVDDIEFKPGSVTEITGGNARGKTSIIEALRVLIGGGTAAHLTREGAASGEVVLELDGGPDQGGYRCRKGVNKTSRATVEGPVSGGAQLIAQLFGTKLVDVARFLNADPKEQTQMILRLCPMAVTKEEVAEVVNLQRLRVSDSAFDQHALEALAGIETLAREERRSIGAKAEEARASAEAVEKALPDLPPPSEQRSEASIADEIEAVRKEFRSQQSAIAAKLSEDCDEARRQVKLFSEDLHSELRELAVQAQELASKQQRVKNQLEVLAAEENREIQKLSDASKKSAQDLEDKAQAAIVALQQVLANVRKEKSAYERRQEQRDFAANQRNRAEKLNAQYAAITDEIKALQALAVKATENLPIPNVSINEEGLLMVDAPGEVRVPISVLNTASKLKLALNVARLAVDSSDTKLVFIDGMEALDDDAYSAVLNAAQKMNDVQFIWTRRTNGPLNITSKP